MLLVVLLALSNLTFWLEFSNNFAGIFFQIRPTHLKRAEFKNILRNVLTYKKVILSGIGYCIGRTSILSLLPSIFLIKSDITEYVLIGAFQKAFEAIYDYTNKESLSSFMILYSIIFLIFHIIPKISPKKEVTEHDIKSLFNQESKLIYYIYILTDYKYSLIFVFNHIFNSSNEIVRKDIISSIPLNVRGIAKSMITDTFDCPENKDRIIQCFKNYEDHFEPEDKEHFNQLIKAGSKPTHSILIKLIEIIGFELLNESISSSSALTAKQFVNKSEFKQRQAIRIAPKKAIRVSLVTPDDNNKIIKGHLIDFSKHPTNNHIKSLGLKLNNNDLEIIKEHEKFIIKSFNGRNNLSVPILFKWIHTNNKKPKNCGFEIDSSHPQQIDLDLLK